MTRDTVSELLDSKGAARLLGISPATLAVWRCHGRGPQWVKVGSAVRYEQGALVQWIAERTRHSTSPTSAPAGTAA